MVVGAERRMISRTDTNRTAAALSRRRAKILDVACDLARTGWHADHTTIVRELEALEGFSSARTRLDHPAFREQLDKLCVMARRT